MAPNPTNIIERCKSKSSAQIRADINAINRNPKTISKKNKDAWERGLKEALLREQRGRMNESSASAKPSKKKRNKNALNKFYFANRVATMQKRAKRKGLTCDITEKDVARLKAEKVCYYTGAEMSPRDSTFDRVDNHIGYMNGNVVMCTENANHLKSAVFENSDIKMRMSEQELMRFASTIYQLRGVSFMRRVKIAYKVLTGCKWWV